MKLKLNDLDPDSTTSIQFMELTTKIECPHNGEMIQDCNCGTKALIKCSIVQKSKKSICLRKDELTFKK